MRCCDRCDRCPRLRHAAMPVRVSMLVLFAGLSALASLVSGPVGDAQAQQPSAERVYRIGFLSHGQPVKVRFEALQQGLRERGYVEGRNLVWELRLTDSLDQLPRLADDLVRLKVEVIVARSSSGAAAAKRATTSIPIVFVPVANPVELGLVRSLGRPGGNLTGLAVDASDLAGKRVQLLKELVPRLKRVAMLSHPGHASNAVQLQGAEAAARTLGVQLEAVPVRSADEFSTALTALHGIEGVLHADTPLFTTHCARLVDAVVRSRLPAIHTDPVCVDAGGLVAYGVDFRDQYHRTALYVDKILKGAKPGDLPVELPTKFDVAINTRTAKAIGLTIPPSLLARADRILE